ncbi:MAG: hypothetical protein WCO35_00405 [Candidatus Nomurabacteria bacterium]
MKKLFMLSSLLVILFSSCQKDLVNVPDQKYNVDVIVSPVLNLQAISANQNVIITSYRIINYGPKVTINSVTLSVYNPIGITSIAYRFTNSTTWNSVSLGIGTTDIVFNVGKTLCTGESTKDFNVRISTGSFYGSGIGITNIKSIDTDLGIWTPASSTEIYFQLYN